MNIFSLTGIEQLYEDEANVVFVSKRRITRHQIGFYTTLDAAEAAMCDWLKLARLWGWSIFGCEITEHALDEKVKGGEKASKEKIEALNRKVDELIAAYRAIETSSVRARQKGLRGGNGVLFMNVRLVPRQVHRELRQMAICKLQDKFQGVNSRRIWRMPLKGLRKQSGSRSDARG